MEGRSERRTYTEEFKKQMVQLYNSGKSQSSIAKEYELTASTLKKWIDRINKTVSSLAKDNLTPMDYDINISVRRITRNMKGLGLWKPTMEVEVCYEYYKLYFGKWRYMAAIRRENKHT